MRNQILHILRKDGRQHRWEIFLSVAIIVAYAWREVSRSRTAAYASYDFSLLSQMLPLLVVVGWAFLIVRAVQAECLVGDRQFWVTRPYEWKKLLAAKLLFVVAFVNIPLLILQVFLLLKAGYPPTSYVRGLLRLQFSWVLFLILPVATMATVTASTGQFMLAILGVLLYLTIVFPAVESFVPAAGVSGATSVPGSLEFLAVVGASLAVVLWQYARRRTAQSRVLLLGAAVAVPAIMLVTQYRMLIERAYPQANSGQQLPVQLAFDPAKQAPHEGAYPGKNKVHVRIPLLVSGVAGGSSVAVDGIIEQVQPPGEQPWTSGWHGGGMVLLANRERSPGRYRH